MCLQSGKLGVACHGSHSGESSHEAYICMLLYYIVIYLLSILMLLGYTVIYLLFNLILLGYTVIYSLFNFMLLDYIFLLSNLWPSFNNTTASTADLKSLQFLCGHKENFRNILKKKHTHTSHLNDHTSRTKSCLWYKIE